MSNLNVDTVTAANVQATGMVSANTALKAPNYADAGKPASADPGVIIYIQLDRMLSCGKVVLG